MDTSSESLPDLLTADPVDKPEIQVISSSKEKYSTLSNRDKTEWFRIEMYRILVLILPDIRLI
jgi:hypothetical protein